MKRIFLLLTILTFLAATAIPVEAQPIQTIVLNDGTTIKGKVISMQNGLYTIETTQLGQLSIHDYNIQTIIHGDADPYPQGSQNLGQNQLPQVQIQGNPQLQGQINQMMPSIMQDQEIMAELQRLMEDPEVVELMSDPQFMNSLMNLDPQNIQNNQSVNTLMTHPKLQKLINIIHSKVQR